MNVALIPVRGGSKSIPLKNIKEFNGEPLVYWTIKAACECKMIDKVYIATDSIEIRDKVQKFPFEKMEVIGRSEESASDNASTESVMIEFAYNYEFEWFVLIQATSPLLTSADLDKGFNLLGDGKYDSVLSAVKQKRFNWNIDAQGMAYPINYDVYNRPRRQEFEGYFVENGAFYITSREEFIKSQNRVSGNIGIVEMDKESFLEIDEPDDWALIEEIMKRRKEIDQINIPEIKMFLTDCDGCLTDGGMYYTNKGDEIKRFNTLDGMGFELLHKNNILTGIITGEEEDLIKKRSMKIKADILASGIKDKLREVEKICEKYQIEWENIAYVGDDINDIAVMKAVGFPCAVKNAMPIVRKNARYITEAEGGKGAIREVIEKILQKQGKTSYEK